MYGGMGANPSPGSYWRKEKWLFDFDYAQPFGAPACSPSATGSTKEAAKRTTRNSPSTRVYP